jgi:hypothetical protein
MTGPKRLALGAALVAAGLTLGAAVGLVALWGLGEMFEFAHEWMTIFF